MTELEIISDLITNMILHGATREELDKAIRHSMAVIDSKITGEDYTQSEKDNDISYLKEKYL